MCCLGRNTSCKNLLMTELATFKYNVRHTKFDGHTSILNEKNKVQTQLNLIDIFGTIWLYAGFEKELVITHVTKCTLKAVQRFKVYGCF